MTLALLVSIAGLAALDAFNPATIAGVALILLLPGEGQVRIATGFVAGAAAIVFVAGVVVFLGLSEGMAHGGLGLGLVRTILLTVAAGVLTVMGLRRLWPRHRRAIALPAWLNPRTAGALGVLVTGADLPNAFPYFIAIERLAAAEVGAAVAVAVLGAYALVYCLPCLVLLVAGARGGDRMRRRLERVHRRLGSAKDLPANPWVTAACLAGAGALLWFAHGT